MKDESRNSRKAQPLLPPFRPSGLPPRREWDVYIFIVWAAEVCFAQNHIRINCSFLFATRFVIFARRSQYLLISVMKINLSAKSDASRSRKPFRTLLRKLLVDNNCVGYVLYVWWATARMKLAKIINSKKCFKCSTWFNYTSSSIRYYLVWNYSP